MGPVLKVKFNPPKNGNIEININLRKKIKFKANSQYSNSINALLESLINILNGNREQTVQWYVSLNENIQFVFSEDFPEPYIRLYIIRKTTNKNPEIIYNICTTINEFVYPFYMAIKELENKITKDEFASKKGWGHTFPEDKMKELEKLSINGLSKLNS